ncbi:Colicin I receptor [Burkholderiales bacterium]|nr:Colicin I receptor [Burkholderiales bacterium]
MKLQRKQLVLAVQAALGLGVAFTLAASGSALAQSQPQKIEKIEVTGSNIKRVDTETVSPVEIISRDQIERTGLATVAEVLRNIPANSGGSFGESFTNSFAPGAAGISLRGLGQKSTLVLINGRRTAGYGFAQNLQDTFVDLNSIPSSAVERIEVLKDGASAVYGSDAIAGVVNVILRKDYVGAQVGGGMGSSEGKSDYRLNAVFGAGDLGKDRFNFFASLDYYKRDLLMLSDTEYGHTRDMRGHRGGRNYQSLTGAGTWRALTSSGSLSTNFRANSDCDGMVLNGAQAVAAGLIAAPLGNASWNNATNTFCAKDFNGQFTAMPKTERLGLLGRATFNFTSNMSGYVEGGYSANKSFQRFQAPFFAGTTGLTPTSAGLRPFTYNITFAPGASGNPFTSNARYVGVLNDMGTRDTEVNSDTYRLLGGLNYSFGSWDFDTGLGWAKNEVESFNFNRLSLVGTSELFGVSTNPQPPVPISTGSTYNLDRWMSNSAASREAMRANFPRQSTSEMTFLDTKANTEMGKLPGGPIGLALGVEFRNEKLQDRPAEIARGGGILGQGITATDGKRDSYAAYGELSLPVTSMIEGSLAARYDHYSDYGSSTTPKVGVKFKPTGNLLLRANWGKGFRAPTLPEISPSVATFFTSVTDPLNNQVTQISGVFAGNPNLEAEKSESATFGVVFEPTKDMNFGVNAYALKWKNIVAAPSFQTIVNAGGPNVIRDPSTNAIVTVLSGYTNLNETKTNGFDFDAKVSFNTGFGRFTTRTSVVYIDSFKENGVETVGTNGGTNTMPRVRGNLALDWDKQPFGATLSMNYIHGYYQTLLPGSYFVEQDPQFQNGVYGERIPSYKTFSLYGKYQLNKNLKITASVLNFTNEKPPFDPGFSGTFLYDFSIYDVRGRQYRLDLEYKIK